MNSDIVNSIFQLIGTYFTWANAFKLYKDKSLKGFYWPNKLFFTFWGLWNIFYFFNLSQPFSFIASMALVSGDILWIIFLFKYRKNLGDKNV